MYPVNPNVRPRLSAGVRVPLAVALAVALALTAPGCAEEPPEPVWCESDAGTASDSGSGAGTDDASGGADGHDVDSKGSGSHDTDGKGSGSDGSGSDGAGSDGSGSGTPPPGTGSPKWAANFDLLLPETDVVDLQLTFAPGDWIGLLHTWRDKQEKVWTPAALVITGMGDDPSKPISLAKVGVRLKGLSSLNVPSSGPVDPVGKYPLKIDFNRFGGPRLFGADKISLSNLIQDRTQLREQLAARVYRAMGVPAPRITFARVHIDGALIGLYALVQPIDKRYLKERFGTAHFGDEGNLYKCVHNTKGVCSLLWKGAAKSDYLLTDACQPGYDDCGLVLKTHEDEAAWNHYRDLAHLTDVLTHTPTAHLETELPKVLDVESALRYVAVTFVLSSYDSYLGKSNNFYVYHQTAGPQGGRFAVLPWDLDGAYHGGYCVDLADPTCSGNSAAYPLVGRLLAVPKWQQRFRELVLEALNGPYTVAWHKSQIAGLTKRIAADVAKDPNYPETVTKWQQLTTLNPPPEYTENLLAFVAKRRAALVAALEGKK